MQKYDVAIFGAGIVGAFIFDTLTLKGLKCVLIDKGEDVCLGASKANSGIIHAGYDCARDTLKAKFNVLGNKMYPEIAKRLGEPIGECGSLVVGDKDSLPVLTELLNRGTYNGVKNLEILDRSGLEKLEKNLNKNIAYGLYAKDAKIISPYHFTIALVEESLLNGGEIKLNYNANSIQRQNDGYLINDGKENFMANYIVNACAEGVNEIGSLVGEPAIPLTYTKGEYVLLDKDEFGLACRPIFPTPTKNSKGILACPTVNGNTFFGPTAEDVKEYETSVTLSGINKIKTSILKMIDNVNFKKTIKLYAGVRVKTGDDFYINFNENKNYFVIAGICSPGLSAAPAIAEYVANSLIEKGLKVKTIKFTPRRPYTNILKLSNQELSNLIKKDKNYGDIVCNCEKVTKGEILEVLNRTPFKLTTDGIKRRLRVTMGRCQGSFCYPRLIKIMADYYNCDEKEICFRGKESLIVGNIKEGGIYAE